MAIGSVYEAYPNGRPSGLPTDIVKQLVDARASQVLTPLENDIQEAKGLKDVYSGMNSSLTGLYEAAQKVNDFDLFTSKAASSSNPEAATVSADESAVEGTYTIEASQLAQSHTMTLEGSSGLSASDDASLINDSVTLSFEHQGVSLSLTTDGETTLDDIAQAINETENLGVSASVINTGTENSADFKLKLKSETTGSGENQITSDGTAAGVNIAGGTLFSGGDVQNEAQAGQNALFTIDGVSYERSSNQVDDAIEGLSFELLSDTAGPSNIGVSLDTKSITGQVQAFVKAYNAYAGFLDKNGSYNPETGQGGALLGDSIARSTQNRLRSLISEPVTGSGENSFQYLSQVGIEFEENGSLSLDSDKLHSALESDAQGVKDIFAGTGGAGEKMETYLRSITNSFDGVIASKISSLETRIDSLNDDYDDKQQYLNNYEDRLVEKFSQLEQSVLKYQGMSDQLSSIIDTWDTGGE